MKFKLEKNSEHQLAACLNLLQEVLGNSLLGVYLYGSAIVGGLQKYSDIDLFVVVNRPTNTQEKKQLVTHLLQISGIYKKSLKRPIEMSIAVKSEINPWHYPPKFDFQYGEWLRVPFEQGNIEPWATKALPDLALLITQVLLASQPLFGPSPQQLLSRVPYKDFILASIDSIEELMATIATDTCNVLLTLARIWSTLATDAMRSKLKAAAWAINHLPKELQIMMERAQAVCRGEHEDSWDALNQVVHTCAKKMIEEIYKQIRVRQLLSEHLNRIITYADDI
ncbi:Streptomycin 3''-adenylyltransferase [Legionella beliardensis]|uniref:Aminoglycoside (3'') (9) adenylyltransferase n=1 Tax=Legionella beliardensis TaxID=91822 RepID=A0A378I2D4_9GAMM|nr:aminoglycoside adenylyltransferase family protein [Legionella beliardensis]STX28861.1 Streptomycin 3''-adenylyltransferase [Legionella beliardensis]